MTKIQSIRTRSVAVPMKRPLRTAGGAVKEAPLVLIDLLTGDGVPGRSYVFGYHRFTLQPLASLVQSLAAMIEGDALAPIDIERKLRGRLALLGPHNLTGIALAGIDMAVWDAFARARQAPLVVALGGAAKAIPAYNSNGLGIMPADEAADEAQQLVDEGFSAIKIRLGRPTLAEDIAAVRAVRSRIPNAVHLMSDFNQSLSTSQALERGYALDQEGVYWIEEPIRADDIAACARIARELRTPIQIGENFSGIFQMQDAIAAQACDMVMPDAQRIGGVTGWLKAAALAQAAGLEMSSHLFPEFSSHLLAVTPSAHWLEYVDWACPVIANPTTVTAGHYPVADKPGAGIEWDEDAVQRFSI